MKARIKNVLNTNKKGLLFIAKIVTIYAVLEGFYSFYLTTETNIDRWLIEIIIAQSEWLLTLMGYQLIDTPLANEFHMGIAGSSGVIIGGPCDGLSLFILFASFIIAFGGKWSFNVLYLILGISFIHFLNIIRVVALALIVVHSPESLDFHHSYTFTLFVYGVVFLLWIWRIQLFQRKEW